MKKEHAMGKKSIHKVSPKQKRVKFWDKTVCIIDKMMQKNYPERIIKLAIQIAKLIMIIKKIFDSFGK